MYIITFYSFKGGVGRTMALVNTAAELARRGRKVLVVDFDLEAPGLSTYDRLRPKKPHPGIVEFVTEFRRTRRSPLVTEFIYPAGAIGKKGGRLWVMPAGRGDAEYRRMLNALNWRTLYQDEEGFLLFEDTRLQWEAEYHPDYVLIDARTGHSDIEGICTRQLADAVVVVFYPNQQNLAGLKEVCRHIRAEETSGLKKKIKLHFVASNVPDLDDERGLLHRHLETFGRDLSIPWPGRPLIIHRRETLKMLDQPVFVLDRPHSKLAREYRRLTRYLIVQNYSRDREGALLYLQELQRKESRLLGRPRQADTINLIDRLKDRVEVAGALELERSVHRITHEFWQDAEIIAATARFLCHVERADRALCRFDRALKLQPDRVDLLLERAKCRQQAGDRAGSAADLLTYLRTPNANLQANLDLILWQLLDVCFETFLEAISGEEFIRPQILVKLIRDRRWQDAIRYLETKPDEMTRGIPAHGNHTAEHVQSRRFFHLAMAIWGDTGIPPRDLCQKAATNFLPPGETEDSWGPQATDYQCLSLLYWSSGDSEKASELLDKALRRMEDNGESDLDHLSYWTFRETTPHEFRQDCEQMACMIRGEPVRPAFLGPGLVLPALQ